jgi:hypothetical protein
LRTALSALALSLGLIWVATSLPAAAAAKPRDQAASAAPASETVAQLAGWVFDSGDNHGLPFVIIDKVAAEVFVFGADGQLRGAAPALLGLARGDRSTPFVGDRELSHIRPKERTTPAGRFDAFVGPAWGGTKVLWVDYAAAISLHPVIIGNPKDHRLRRLQTPTPKDNRITFGCINVPAAFYERVVRPAFTRTKGVFYILPEATPLKEVFPFFQAQLAAASPRPDPGGSHPATNPDEQIATAVRPDRVGSDPASIPDEQIATAVRPDRVGSDPASIPDEPIDTVPDEPIVTATRPDRVGPGHASPYGKWTVIRGSTSCSGWSGAKPTADAQTAPRIRSCVRLAPKKPAQHPTRERREPPASPESLVGDARP